MKAGWHIGSVKSLLHDHIKTKKTILNPHLQAIGGWSVITFKLQLFIFLFCIHTKTDCIFKVKVNVRISIIEAWINMMRKRITLSFGFFHFHFQDIFKKAKYDFGYVFLTCFKNVEQVENHKCWIPLESQIVEYLTRTTLLHKPEGRTPAALKLLRSDDCFAVPSGARQQFTDRQSSIACLGSWCFISGAAVTHSAFFSFSKIRTEAAARTSLTIYLLCVALCQLRVTQTGL